MLNDIINLYPDYHWPYELKLLNHYASLVRDPEVIVAIGSYRGQSDCAIALDAKVPVYCIDPRYQEVDGVVTHYGDVDRRFWFENVLKFGVAEKVRPINLTSDDAYFGFPGETEVGFLFIDGDHSYGQVSNDIINWSNTLSDNGVIAIHDIDQEGVKKALFKVKQEPTFREIATADRTLFFKV